MMEPLTPAGRVIANSYGSGLSESKKKSLISDIIVVERKARTLGYGDEAMAWVLPWHLDAYWKNLP